jgi:RNA polymerase sigma factor (sigma-70 family)
MTFDLQLLGDPDADPDAHRREWTRVFNHFTPRLDSYFAARVPNKSDREDLIQHIWSKAILRVSSLSDASVLWNWLRRVGENRLTDLQRSGLVVERYAAAHAADVRHELATSPPPSALDHLVSNPFDGEVGRQFAALSPLDQQLVILAMDEVPHEEIARRLGLPSAAASRQRLHRLRSVLRSGWQSTPE